MPSVGTIKYKNGSSWVDILHPVNSFYISYASTSPASLFGGTWTQVTNAVIRGASSVGYTGADTHTLTTNEMPSHNHPHNTNTWLGYWASSGSNGSSTTSSGGYRLYASNHWTDSVLTSVKAGGGQHIQSCNAPSIAIFGIVPRRPQEGDVVWYM